MARGALTNHGLLVRASDEADSLAWRTFTSLESSADPQLVITYNTAPATPGLLSPAAGASGACDPTLSASFSDPEGGEGRVDYQVLDSSGALVVGGSADSSTGKANWKVPHNADGTCKLAAGQSYSWRARAYDGRDYSGWSAGRSYSIPSAPASNVIWRSGFEDSTFAEWELHQSLPDRIASVSAPVQEGARAGRFEIRGGDLYSGTARAELGYTDNMGSEGQVRTYKWSTMVASDYPSVDKWQDILQWKNEGTGTPPLQMKIQGDEIGLSGGPQINYRWPWKTALKRGEWLDFNVRIKWSEDPNVGWIEASYEGQQVLARYPMATLYPGLKNYLKVGLYRDSSITQTGVVYHDDLTISSE